MDKINEKNKIEAIIKLKEAVKVLEGSPIYYIEKTYKYDTYYDYKPGDLIPIERKRCVGVDYIVNFKIINQYNLELLFSNEPFFFDRESAEWFAYKKHLEENGAKNE